MSNKPRRGERYAALPAHIYNSKAWRTLPKIAQALYIDLRTQHNGHNNGRIACIFGQMKEWGWHAPATLTKAKGHLLARGFITCTRVGKRGPNCICSLYGFTDIAIEQNDKEFVRPQPPTNRYQRWEPGVEFERVNSSDESFRDSTAEPDRIRNRTGTDSEIEQLPTRLIQEVKHGNPAVDRPRPAPVLGLRQLGG